VGLPVNVDWEMTDITHLAEALLAQTQGTQVVAWEHHLGEQLAKHLLMVLGGNPTEVPQWSDTDFDSVYVIRITGHDQGIQATVTHDNEELNNLSDSCAK
jgi:hypothetical protein